MWVYIDKAIGLLLFALSITYKVKMNTSKKQILKVSAKVIVVDLTILIMTLRTLSLGHDLNDFITL